MEAVMGFRSTFVTEDLRGSFPEWFVSKWQKYIHFGRDKGLPISSRYEAKTYGTWTELPIDIQRVLIEWAATGPSKIVLVWLHECGGITRVQIDKARIILSEPQGWEVVNDVMHWYCYGCSDMPEATDEVR